MEAEDFVWRRQQARAEQARRADVRAETEACAERERLAAEAADSCEVEHGLPCPTSKEW